VPVTRFAHDAVAAEIVLRRHNGAKTRFSASARLALPGRDVHGRAVDWNLYVAIGKLVAKLGRLLRKRKTRLAKKFERPDRTEEMIRTKEINHMNNRKIIMTAADHEELEAVITFTGKVSERARAELNALEGELKRAEIVESEKIPSDVITMNSRAELLDLETKERMQFTLVLPRDAKIDEGKISVLAPLGTAMLGYRVGDEFQWHVPYGVRRLKVTNVYFQPEAERKKAA
jgi:regulator of nucleoside diphosphate kinase